MSTEEQKPVVAPADAAAAPAAAAAEGEPAKKNPKQDAKEARKLARLAEEAEKAKAKAELLKQYAGIFGPSELIRSTAHKSKVFTTIAKLDVSMVDQTVLVRARVHNTRGKGKMAFVVLRDTFESVQCVLTVDDTRPKEMIDFAGSIAPESIVDVEALVVAAAQPIKSTSKSDIELSIVKMHVVSASQPVLPFQFEDASQPDAPVTEGEAAAPPTAEGDSRAKVNLETRLNCRWLDMRTKASNALFRVSSRMSQYFREFLTEQDFVEIHTPKLIGTASEGGANVFKLPYFGKDAFLAQSPQLYKQMALQGDLERVFEIAPVFRAENANTARHMTEFISMDMEMRINEHYYEVLDTAEELFSYIFDKIAAHKDLLAAVQEQHPFVPIVYRIPAETIAALGVGIIDENVPCTDVYGARIRNRQLSVLRIPFPGGIALYNAQSGVEKIPDNEDIGTEAERTLGCLVKERYGVDYYIMDRYPAAARPFYTMPDPVDPQFSNSYDMFIRGQEIVSGAQRIHDAELLTKRAIECGVAPESIKDYIDSFRLGGWPHGGFAIGLERMVFLYLGLSNVRYASLFPRDPKRCAP